MRRLYWLFFVCCGVLLQPALAATSNPSQPGLITIDGPIGVPTANYIHRTLQAAEKSQRPFVVLQLDTPGGLSSAMRDIIEDIVQSPIPVVCWVGPGGSRAASAGTYILYACGLSAMAKGTNMGAATPVSLSGLSGSKTPAKPKTAEGKKVLNDAIAYIQGLAELRGRNADWAEKAVRDGDSITAQQALDKGVVDLLAADLPGLLNAIDGRVVPTSQGDVTLHSQGAQLQPLQLNWKEQALSFLATPTVAYLLLMMGIFGLILEGLNPGTVLPGTVGGIALILALFALNVLPVSWAGFALILLGAALVVGEAFAPSFGVLGLGGIVAFVVGSLMLFKSPAPGFTLPLVYIGSFALVASLGLALLVYFLMKMRRTPVASGLDFMVGQVVHAMQAFEKTGYVLIEGERWKAHTTEPVEKGATVQVDRVDGLSLFVHPVADPHDISHTQPTKTLKEE